MLRSYHVSDYGWTPLSQNPCWKAAILAFSDVILSKYSHVFGHGQDHTMVGYSLRFKNLSGPAEASSNIEKVKSFVYDLNIEPGIVSMRVVLVPRSAEIQPRFWRFVHFLPLHSFYLRGSQVITIYTILNVATKIFFDKAIWGARRWNCRVGRLKEVDWKI